MGWKGTLRSIEAAARRAEREAVKRQRELEKQHRQLEKMQEAERAAYEVQVYENYIDVIGTIHKDSSEAWNWEEIQLTNPPTEPAKSDIHERTAQKSLDAYKPGFTDKLLKRVESKQSELAFAVKNGKRKDELKYQEALKEHEENHKEWEEILNLATRILSGDESAYAEAIQEIAPFDEISQLGSSIEFSIEKNDLVPILKMI
jgi:hypothetical protein